MRVAAGSEPFLFTSQFVGWDPDFAKKNIFVDPYQVRFFKIPSLLSHQLIHK